jgi:hypothetical protein
MPRLSLTEEHDPVKKADREFFRFSSAWAGKGKPPSGVQRVGFGLLSIVCLGSAAVFGSSFMELLQARQLNAIYFFGVTVFFLFLSIIGLRNVVRR